MNKIMYTFIIWSLSIGQAVSGERIFVTFDHLNTVSTVYTDIESFDYSIEVGIKPEGMMVNRDASILFVANQFDNTITIIDTLSFLVTGVVKVGERPYAILAHPDGKRLLVTNYYEDTVTVIDTPTQKVIQTLITGKGPYAITTNPSGSLIFISNYWEDNTVMIISSTTYKLLATIKVGASPVSMTSDNKYIYVANDLDQTITIIDYMLKSDTLEAFFDCNLL